jgi:hypothetical protein
MEKERKFKQYLKAGQASTTMCFLWKEKRKKKNERACSPQGLSKWGPKFWMKYGKQEYGNG